MRIGQPKAPVILSDDERRRLDSLAHRSRSAPAVARRARIDSRVCQRHGQHGRRAAVARHAGNGLRVAGAVHQRSVGRTLR